MIPGLRLQAVSHRGRRRPQNPPALEQEAVLARTTPADQQHDQALSGENPRPDPALELTESAPRFIEPAPKCGQLFLYHIQLGDDAQRELRDLLEIDVHVPFLANLGQSPLDIRQPFRRIGQRFACRSDGRRQFGRAFQIHVPLRRR